MILISIEAEFPALQSYRELFLNFILVLELNFFFWKNAIFSQKTEKTEIPEDLIIFRIRKLKKRSVTLFSTKFCIFWYQYQSCSSKTVPVLFFWRYKNATFQESVFSKKIFVILMKKAIFIHLRNIGGPHLVSKCQFA